MHMWSLTFNGQLQCKHPSEFLDDVKEIMKKHDAYYIGGVNRYDLGEFVDFVEIKDVEPNTKADVDIQKEDTNSDIQSGD